MKYDLNILKAKKQQVDRVFKIGIPMAELSINRDRIQALGLAESELIINRNSNLKL